MRRTRVDAGLNGSRSSGGTRSIVLGKALILVFLGVLAGRYLHSDARADNQLAHEITLADLSMTRALHVFG